jgi:RNA polymerase sigma factor (sigma-70 family)
MKMISVKSLSYEELERQWSGMLHRFATWRVPSYDYADVYQELRIVLWKAQQSYNPRRGVAFTTFLYRACVNKVGKLLDHTRARKRVPTDMQLQLCDDQHQERRWCTVCKELPSTVMSTEAFDLLSMSSPEEQQLAGLVLYGYTRRSEWVRLGLTEEQIKRGIIDLKRVMKRRAR